MAGTSFAPERVEEAKSNSAGVASVLDTATSGLTVSVFEQEAIKPAKSTTENKLIFFIGFLFE